MIPLKSAPEKVVSIEEAVRYLREDHPRIWDAVSTKYIDSPAAYYPYRTVHVGLAAAIAESTFGNNMLISNLGASAAMMKLHNFPTYFVSKELLESCMHTTPRGMTWKDVLLPYPGLIFMLPRGALKEQPSGKDIAWLAIAKIPRTTVKMPGTDVGVSGDKNWVDDRINIACCIAPECMETQNTTFPNSETLCPNPDWIDAMTAKFSTDYDRKNFPDGHFSSYIAGVAAMLLLTMQVKPELVERGQATKKVLKSGLRVHTPTYLGRKYKVRREVPQKNSPTGAYFTEVGWRSGHAKKVHCGEGRTSERIVIVEPYMAFVRGLRRA